MVKPTSAKRARIEASKLQWRALPTEGAMLDEGGGMMMLEEADGVDVHWEEDAAGRKTAVLVVREPRGYR